MRFNVAIYRKVSVEQEANVEIEAVSEVAARKAITEMMEDDENYPLDAHFVDLTHPQIDMYHISHVLKYNDTDLDEVVVTE